jgi:Periplasmic lysozyme inhibitor of I-type lysozyme
LIDLTGEKKKDVIVTIRCVGTGAYLSADAFAIQDKRLMLLAHVEGLEPTANVITALKKEIRSQKR